MRKQSPVCKLCISLNELLHAFLYLESSESIAITFYYFSKTYHVYKKLVLTFSVRDKSGHTLEVVHFLARPAQKKVRFENR